MASHIERRKFLAALGGVAAAWPLAAHAQASKTLRMGIVSINPRTSPVWMAFLQRLRELGHIEGQNFTPEFVLGGAPETYYEGMKELVRRNVDLLIATGNEIALKSALAATNSLPIVMLAIDYDPLARGYVTSGATIRQCHWPVLPTDRTLNEANGTVKGSLSRIAGRDNSVGSDDG